MQSFKHVKPLSAGGLYRDRRWPGFGLCLLPLIYIVTKRSVSFYIWKIKMRPAFSKNSEEWSITELKRVKILSPSTPLCNRASWPWPCWHFGLDLSLFALLWGCPVHVGHLEASLASTHSCQRPCLPVPELWQPQMSSDFAKYHPHWELLCSLRSWGLSLCVFLSFSLCLLIIPSLPPSISFSFSPFPLLFKNSITLYIFILQLTLKNPFIKVWHTYMKVCK